MTGMLCDLALSRGEYMYMAKLAEQAERYDEMGRFMEEMVKQTSSIGEFTTEQRQLISLSFKNMVGARRASWQVVSTIEEKDISKVKEVDSRNDDCASLIRGYRNRIEADLEEICTRIFSMIDSHLIPFASSSEAKVFFLKMKGDYHRYLAEIKVGEERKEEAARTMMAYKEAEDIAIVDLPTINPTRLGLALNVSVYYFEILNLSERACFMADEAFNEAIEVLEKLPEESHKESRHILRLLRTNFIIWTSDAQIF